MVTTIQLKEKIKDALDGLKENARETYEEVIVKMMKQLEEQKRKQIDLMIEGAKEMHNDMLKISKEWEGTLMDGLDKNEKWKELEEER